MSEQEINKVGRPPFEPTQDMRVFVETLTGYGITQEDVAKLLADRYKTADGLCGATLRKVFRAELDTGALKANSRVAESLYRRAISNEKEAVTAAIFWLKTRAGWKDVVHNVHGVDPENPIVALLTRIADDGKKVHDPER